MVTKRRPVKMPQPHDRIRIPVAKAPPSREIESRRALALRVLALRSEIGPIGIPIEELIRQVRDETDAGAD